MVIKVYAQDNNITRRPVYVEIPKPSRVELKCNAEGFDVILATPVSVLGSQHRPDADGLI
jgi:hypothetical protein